MPNLLDNDVFLAALYEGHVAHSVCRDWLDNIKPSGWAIAIETHLAAQRLLMNPTVMGSAALDGKSAYRVVTTELAGRFPGELLFPLNAPDEALFSKAMGHRQIMDFWLVQVARDHGCTLVTRDVGLHRQFPETTLLPSRG